ncbi:MAG: hypothetical protein ACRDGE_11615 [Candidatus Limnocylindria bacterium]
MAKRRFSITVQLPAYARPRNEWRRQVHTAVLEAQTRRGVGYQDADRLELSIFLALGAAIFAAARIATGTALGPIQGRADSRPKRRSRTFSSHTMPAVREFAAGAAVVGGLIWIATVVMTALRPIGLAGAHRSTLDLHPTILVAFVLMALAATKLASELGASRLAWAGAVGSWIAVALFSVNVAVVLATGDDASVWLTHYSSFFLMALGLGLLGVAVLRRRAAPASLAIAMIAPPILMPLGQMQDDRVLLWLPLGLASIALGGCALDGSLRK